MANTRSSGGSRGRDLFRTEVSSLVADLGELAGEEAPEQPRAGSGSGAGSAPPPPSTPPPPPPASTIPEPPAPATPGPVLADTGDPAAIEDLPSYSPSYLPPLPPMLPPPPAAKTAPAPRPEPSPADRVPPAPGGWLAAALAAGAAAERAPAPQRPAPPPDTWPEPPDPYLAPVQDESATGTELGAPVLLEPLLDLEEPLPAPAPVRDAAARRGAEPDPEGPASEPGALEWHVSSQPAPAHFPDLAGLPEWEPPPGEGGAGQGSEPGAIANEHGQRFRITPPWDAASPAEPVGPPRPGVSGPPPGTASGPPPPNQRLGLPLIPGSAPTPVSTRPWSLAAAMQPLAPLGPAPSRAGALATVEPAGPEPARARRSRFHLPFAAIVTVLIVVLAALAVLIVLGLHP